MANVSVTKCGNTKYSAGRMESNVRTPYGSAFEIRASVRPPTNGQRCTRAAVWSKNTKDYCSTNNTKTSLGEFDLVEWYPDVANTAESVTHMSLQRLDARAGFDKRWKTEQEVKKVPTFNDDGWHEWIVQREANWVSYFMRAGGQEAVYIGSSICGQGEFGFSQPRCDEIMNDPFDVILQQEVFINGGDGGHPGPEIVTNFNAQ